MAENESQADAFTLPSWLAGQETLWSMLLPASRRILATAAHLEAVFRQAAHLDWSPVITLGFKAFEVELLLRILEPFRSHFRETLASGTGQRLASQLKSEEWSRPLGRFLEGGRPPALAETATYLASLKGVPADTPGSALALLKQWLRSRHPQAHHFWGPRRVARKLEQATIEFRNLYTHDHVAGPAEVTTAFTRIWGQPGRSGVLVQALRLLTAESPASRVASAAGLSGANHNPAS